MCGIVVHVGAGSSAERLVSSLENLEYRGYDSVGVALRNGTGIEVYKDTGRVSDIRDSMTESGETTVGIGHTR
jgi:glucosamine--fructose-6-phosphate aminotransferase (isomerizing)